MLPIIIGLFVFIYSTDILLLFLFGLHSLLMVYLYRKNTQYCVSDSSLYYNEKTKNLPFVTIQLPIYNEFYVVDRLLGSVLSLKYPKDKLEIQVLDDSTDETVDKISSIVSIYQKK